MGDLVVSTVRTTRRVPFVGGLVIGSAIIVVPLVAGVRFEFVDVTLLVRLAMVLSIGGAAFLLDDPTLGASQVLPTTALQIAVLRMALAVAVLVPVGVIQLSLAPHLVQAQAPFHGRGLLVEPIALLVWAWALAWYRAAHQPDGSGGALAAPALFVAALGFGFLPTSIALYLNPADPDFADSRLRWLAVLILGITALAISLRLSTRPPPQLTWPRRRDSV